MASVLRMSLGNALNVLLAHPSAITRRERCASSETARQPSRIVIENGVAQSGAENERKVTRKSVYLTSRAADILVETAREEVESESHVASCALIFYAERGAYMEELIKKSIQEALQELTPATTRRRVLMRTAGSARGRDKSCQRTQLSQ